MYKRFYDVENYQNNFIRAWHGHKRESKLLILRKGAALVGVVKINDWDKPSRKNKVYKFFLDERSPQAVFIPKGSIHRIQNSGKKIVKIMEVQLGSILKEEDIVRYEDIYGRTN